MSEISGIDLRAPTDQIYRVDLSAMTYAVGTTAVGWACAVSILAGASIGSDFTYLPTTGQT